MSSDEPEEETKKKKKRRKKKKKPGALLTEESDAPPHSLKPQPTVKPEESQKATPKFQTTSNPADERKVLTGKKANKRKRTVSNEPAMDHVNKKPLVSLLDHSGKDSASSAKLKRKLNKDVKKKKKKKKPVDTAKSLSDERLKAYGINPKKFKYTYGKGKTK